MTRGTLGQREALRPERRKRPTADQIVKSPARNKPSKISISCAVGPRLSGCREPALSGRWSPRRHHDAHAGAVRRLHSQPRARPRYEMPARPRRRRARLGRESRRRSLPVRRVVPRPGRFGTSARHVKEAMADGSASSRPARKEEHLAVLPRPGGHPTVAEAQEVHSLPATGTHGLSSRRSD